MALHRQIQEVRGSQYYIIHGLQGAMTYAEGTRGNGLRFSALAYHSPRRINHYDDPYPCEIIECRQAYCHGERMDIVRERPDEDIFLELEMSYWRIFGEGKEEVA